MLYYKMREMLLKLAVPKDTAPMELEAMRGSGFTFPHSMICWDMGKRPNEEDILSEVIHSVRTALRAKFLAIPCVAPFYSLERKDMKMSLVVENPKVNLRAIIGQRKLMEEKGQLIVLKLLEAAVLMEQDEFFLRRIQPMSTMFTEDL